MHELGDNCCRYRPNQSLRTHANLNSVVTKRNVEKKKTIEKEKLMFFIYPKNSTRSQVQRKPLRLSPAQPNISSVTEISSNHLKHDVFKQAPSLHVLPFNGIDVGSCLAIKAPNTTTGGVVLVQYKRISTFYFRKKMYWKFLHCYFSFFLSAGLRTPRSTSTPLWSWCVDNVQWRWIRSFGCRRVFTHRRLSSSLINGYMLIFTPPLAEDHSWILQVPHSNSRIARCQPAGNLPTLITNCTCNCYSFQASWSLCVNLIMIPRF